MTSGKDMDLDVKCMALAQFPRVTQSCQTRELGYMSVASVLANILDS